MALKVTFGNGGAASVSSLTSLIDQEAYKLLTESTAQVKNGSSMETGSVNVGSVSVPGTGAGGTVDVGYDASANAFKFDVSSAWNSVKNALAQSDTSENLIFKDFVQVDVHLGGTGSSNVDVSNAKRGNISTGAGNDTVTVSVVSNDKNWVNAFNIDTGAGNDTIVVKAGTAFNEAGAGGITAGTNVVNGGAGVTDGSFTSVKIDAGAGDDKIDLSGVNLASSLVTGGKGVDKIVASGGADTFVFNLGDMAKSLATDTIANFDATMDKLKLVNTTIDNWAVTTIDNDTILSYNVSGDHKGEKIILSNVHLTGNDWFTA
ncbi:M10 family metallopeptidase C-terminal domain-containing protein [Agrobacterium fabrum]|uniref:Peptidase M10 serralysin C-terminal domain-containing protein n=1 Tax=Agrobacterium fabrum TaxID=1176649 RepID=A0A7Z7FRB5_9HYPH|nr:rhizobiocin [Agrobacterium fabrum]MCR6723882.1 rhizobiocin [Agrobacterium fabrum]UXT58322.1 rhizobiocin [Agrobacterium fabrum]WIE27073.1 rhizobiocin [Agrobacterium fabrum]WIE43030.1 rhizobiocin [Agrobacterium fabrum]CUX32298.1 Rhizobiocin [Agrobacterium fabrum str. J-07]